MSKQPHTAAVTIAPAAAENLPGVVDLCMMVETQHEAYWPLRWKTRPGIREGYLRWMQSHLADPRMLILAATTPDPSNPAPLVVGTLLAVIETEIPIYTYKEFAFIHDLAVAEPYRGLGLARQLMQHAQTWAATHNVNQLRLMVAEQNTPAKATFEKLGFRTTYHEMILPLAPPTP